MASTNQLWCVCSVCVCFLCQEKQRSDRFPGNLNSKNSSSWKLTFFSIWLLDTCRILLTPQSDVYFFSQEMTQGEEDIEIIPENLTSTAVYIVNVWYNHTYILHHYVVIIMITTLHLYTAVLHKWLVSLLGFLKHKVAKTTYFQY